jgi:hypothetical protein
LLQPILQQLSYTTWWIIQLPPIITLLFIVWAENNKASWELHVTQYSQGHVTMQVPFEEQEPVQPAVVLTPTVHELLTAMMLVEHVSEPGLHTDSKQVPVLLVLSQVFSVLTHCAEELPTACRHCQDI